MQIYSAVNRRNWLSGGAHFFIITATIQINSAKVWPYALMAMSVVSFAAWIANYRRMRGIADTPLSTIASAAQGYVEIAGRAEYGAAPVLSKLTQLPCLWFQYEVREKSGDDNWTLKDAGTSEEPFIVRDASAACLIDPRGADVISSNERTWTEGDFRYLERLLQAGEKIYGLGEFATVGGAGSVINTNADISTLLAEWKRDPATLLSRFDLNGDGRIDLQEWELARRQARREVEADQRQRLSREGTHTLRKPQDDRVYILSNLVPEKLRTGYLCWAWGHALLCIAASGGAVGLFSLF
jgi:hypothetical protein